jgi:hypothetical protein
MESARDRALSNDGGPMWISQDVLECWHNWRPGRSIRRKWRIQDGKVESGLDRKFGAPMIVG